MLKLEGIADALGWPIDAFLDPAALAAMDATMDMLRLWQALDSDEARTAVRNVARSLVSVQAARASASAREQPLPAP